MLKANPSHDVNAAAGSPPFTKAHHKYSVADVVAETPGVGSLAVVGHNAHNDAVASNSIQSRFKKKAEEARLKKEKEDAKFKIFIHPKNKVKMNWDIFVGVLIVYSVLIIPLRIGFDVDAVGFMV